MWKWNIFSSSEAKFPYQTPQVLLSYVSKDGPEGEEVLSISCLTGERLPGFWSLENGYQSMARLQFS